MCLSIILCLHVPCMLERCLKAVLMKESPGDQRVGQGGLPSFVISVCFPFICLCGDVVISVDTTGTAAPQRKQQHIETGRGKKVAVFFIYVVALEGFLSSDREAALY